MNNVTTKTRSVPAVSTAAARRRTDKPSPNGAHPSEVAPKHAKHFITDLVAHDNLRDCGRDGKQVRGGTGARSRERILEEDARVDDQEWARRIQLTGRGVGR